MEDDERRGEGADKRDKGEVTNGDNEESDETRSKLRKMLLSRTRSPGIDSDFSTEVGRNYRKLIKPTIVSIDFGWIQQFFKHHSIAILILSV